MPEKRENLFLSLIFNIFLPVWILNRGGDWIPFSPPELYALALALSIPFLYGLRDLIKFRKLNWISLTGLVSIALTGGMALFQAGGIYFAIKEAAIPLVFALISAFSVFLKKPLARLFIFKSLIFDTALIQKKLKERGTERGFSRLMDLSTFGFSGSLCLSAVLNFIIALMVFKTPDPHLEEGLKRQLLNEQVADMNWMGYVFIALPLTLVTGILSYWILRQLKLLTGLSLQELVPKVAKDFQDK